MKVNPAIFRGYDIRGLVGEDLNPELVECIGKAFGTYLKRHDLHEAVIGHDSRATSPEYSEAMKKGLSWAGIDVIDIGMTLVGTFYWSQYKLEKKGGVFVTASHNPPEFNGFKFANGYSETLVTEGMKELCQMVQEDDYEQGDKPGETTEKDVKEDYFEDVIKRVPFEGKMKVVVDSSNTTAGMFVPDLLRRVGCEVVERNTEIDPTFPLGIADPTEKAVLNRLSKEVLEAGADIGLTFDCDGDRIGVVDEKGGLIWNDVLVALFAEAVLEDHPGDKIMFNTFCSRAVPETIKEKGGEPFMWRTGHSFLKKKNQEVKAAFIGELSGHFFFSADFYNHDDGMYSVLRLLRYISNSGKKLSELVAELPQYVSSPEIKLFCADDKKVALIEKLVPILKEDYPGSEIVDDERAGDGVRLETEDSMMMLRYSQNGPYLGLKFESKTEEGYEKLRAYLSDLLHKFPEVEWDNKISANVEVLESK